MIRKNFIWLLAIMLVLVSCAKSGADSSSTTNIPVANSKVRIDISEVMWKLDDKITVPAYVYNKTMPGQTIRVKKGDRVQINGKNSLPIRTSIHWHGLEVPVSQDGTMTSFDAGQDFNYDFIARHSGTYFYHTHTRPVAEQMDMGLNGAFIIEDPIDALYNGDYTVMVDDIFLSDDGKRVEGGSGVGHLEKLGNNIAINGKIGSAIVPLKASANGIYKIRFINPSSNAFYEIKNELDFLITHMDGSPLPTAVSKNSFKMGPGERVDVEFKSMNNGSFPFTLTLMDKFYNGKTYGVFATLPIKVAGTVKQDKERIYLDTPVVLPADFDALASKKPDYEMVLNSRMKGMDMSGMEGMDHSKMDMSGMKGMDHSNMKGMDHGNMPKDMSGSMLSMMEWTINGEIFPNVPPIAMKKGSYIKVRMRNNDMHPMDHPIHLHGTKFMVLSVNGKPYLDGEFGDTLQKDVVNVPIDGYVDILFTINEIGTWMFHCHILDHEDKGMMMTIDVSE